MDIDLFLWLFKIQPLLLKKQIFYFELIRIRFGIESYSLYAKLSTILFLTLALITLI